MLDLIEFEPMGIYVMDRAFVDFSRLYTIHQQHAYFITRAKTNMKFKRIYSTKTNKDDGVMADQTIELVNFYVAKDYPENFAESNFMMQKPARNSSF